MVRLFSKKKMFSSLFKEHKPGFFCTRFFSNLPVNPLWNKLCERDRIEYALAVSEPENAEVAFYKGKGFKSLGTEYAGAAIAAFTLAAKMDPNYRFASQMEIGHVYNQAGQTAEAYKYVEKACQEIIHALSQTTLKEIMKIKDTVELVKKEAENQHTVCPSS
jgi:hypothetical protein